MAGGNPVLADLATPRDVPALKATDRPGIIDVRFVNAAVDAASLVNGQSVRVFDDQGNALAPNITLRPGNIVRLALDGLKQGNRYRVELRGDQPAVTSQAGAQPAHALDGERTSAWPTGNGVSGGNYEFGFAVT
jgi:hypothetical protein